MELFWASFPASSLPLQILRKSGSGEEGRDILSHSYQIIAADAAAPHFFSFFSPSCHQSALPPFCFHCPIVCSPTLFCLVQPTLRRLLCKWLRRTCYHSVSPAGRCNRQTDRTTKHYNMVTTKLAIC